MTSVDPATIASQLAQLSSAVDGAAGQLQAAAPSGRFAQVLAGVDAQLSDAMSGAGGPAGASAGATTGGGSTGSGSGVGGSAPPGTLAASAGFLPTAALFATSTGGSGLTAAELGLGALPTLEAASAAGMGGVGVGGVGMGGAGVGSAGPAAASSPISGNTVVADAVRYLGVPYQWGGTSPATGFDCSGLVQHVFADLGVALPRTSQQQVQAGVAVPSLAQAQPGDLLFFEPGPSGPGHVAIYVGNGQMLDAPHTGSSVRIEPVWGQPVAIRRIVGAGRGAGGRLAALPPALAAAGTLVGNGAVPATLGVPAALVPLFETAAARHGVPAALLAAVAKQESGFDPSAVSSAGAQGLMQLMPSTAASLGVDPFDPAQAISGAAQLLGSYLAHYSGSTPLALAAYNAGPGAVAAYGGVPPYAQTQSYVSDILAMVQGGAA